MLYVTTKWQNWFAKRVLGSFLINRVYIFPFKCVTQHIFSLFWIAGSSPQRKRQSFYKPVCTNSYESYLVFCIKFISPPPSSSDGLFSVFLVCWGSSLHDLPLLKTWRPLSFPHFCFQTYPFKVQGIIDAPQIKDNLSFSHQVEHYFVVLLLHHFRLSTFSSRHPSPKKKHRFCLALWFFTC